MSPTKNIFAILLVSAGQICQPLYAETPSEWGEPATKLADMWSARKDRFTLDNDVVGRKYLEKLRWLQVQYGITSLPSYSYLLVQEAARQPEKSRESAAELIKYASLFGPDLPFVDYYRCKHATGVFQTLGSFRHCIRGWQKEWSRNETKLRFLSNSFFVGFYSFVVFAAVFFLFLLAAHMISVLRYWSLRFYGWSPVVLSVVFLCTTFLSWIALGWIGVATFLSFVLWRHLKTAEKLIVNLLLIISLLLPIAFVLPALGHRYIQGIAPVLQRPLEGADYSRQATLLQSWLERHPQDWAALFTLARLEKQTGRRKQAREIYERVSSLQPSWHKPLVNLANIEYLEQHTEAALAFLTKATLLSPPSVLAHFNLGSILIRETRLEEGQAALRKAKEIDPPQFAWLDRNKNANGENSLFDAELTGEELHSRIWGIGQDVRALRNDMQAQVFPMLPGKSYWIFFLVAWLILIMAAKYFPLKKLAGLQDVPHSASSGGTPIDIFDPSMVSNLGLKPTLASMAWSKFTSFGCTLVLPGSHFLFQGKYFLGGVSLWGTIFLVVSLALEPWYWKSSFATLPMGSTSLWEVKIASLAILYGLLVWKAVQRK